MILIGRSLLTLRLPVMQNYMILMVMVSLTTDVLLFTEWVNAKRLGQTGESAISAWLY